MKNSFVVFGPPGTGKTTYLLNLIDEMLSKGTDPTEIGFFSYTRKAAEEAVSRATKRFKLPKGRFPFFSTLHSFCFRELDYNASAVISEKDLLEIAGLLGHEIQDEVQALTWTRTYGRALALHSVTGRPWLDVWPEASLSDILLLEQMETYLVRYKEATGKIDFSDMLTLWKKTKEPPRFKALFIDEAQDISPDQWEVVEALAEAAELVYIAGDDDQAIYNWAGADVTRFQQWPGERIVLSQSYRLPSSVHALAQQWVSRINTRVDKVFAPREEQGQVSVISSLSHLDLTKGEWLFLHRNRHNASSMEQKLTSLGIPCSLVSGGYKRMPFEDVMKEVQIIQDFFTKGVTARNYRKIAEKSRLSLDSRIFRQASGGLITASIVDPTLTPEKILHIPAVARDYIRSVLSRGLDLFAYKRITLGTIHGSKGGECDNVVLDLRWPRRCLLSDPDSEHRVWYVGATRAKKNLYLLVSEKGNQYAY